MADRRVCCVRFARAAEKVANKVREEKDEINTGVRFLIGEILDFSAGEQSPLVWAQLPGTCQRDILGGDFALLLKAF